MHARLTTGGIALAAHVALLLALPGRSRVVTIPDGEVEITAESTPTVPDAPLASEAPSSRTARPGLAAMPASRERRAPVAAPAATTVSTTTDDFTPFRSTVDLGLGRAIPPSGPVVEPPPTTQPPAPAAARAVTDALLGRDLTLGLGPEGPLLSALIAATQASRAPLHGAATFEATIAADGHVTALRVVDSADEGWDDARGRTLEALAGKTANLRGRDGAIVRVLVTSRTIEAPKGVFDKASAIVFLEIGELARKQQRSVHVRLLSVR